MRNAIRMQYYLKLLKVFSSFFHVYMQAARLPIVIAHCYVVHNVYAI